MTNNKLTDKRSRLRDAAKNYQTALAWYQSNIDSPAALQTWDAATAEFMAAIGNRETDIIADLLDEIDELQERRKADSEREQVRREHAEWSQATFGNVAPIGPLKHLSKEALEAAADPSDPLEWADMQFLLWDAQRRMGISDEFITRAMVEKLAINKGRQWPEPKDGEPRMHIKEGAAQLSGNTEQLNQAPVKQPSSNCPKCGGYGTYHCPQMLGTVECECTRPDSNSGNGLS